MGQTTLIPPDNNAKLPNTRDENAENGWSFKRVVDAINTMFTELYAAVAGFTTVTATITADRPFVVPSYTVATAPETAPAGALIYVTDGDAGSACFAVGNGTNWKVVSLGATIAAA